MKVQFEFDGKRYECSLSDARSIAISMDFDGPQPNHFGAPKAHRNSLELGGFVGDTEQGGSCNVDTLELIPHCNGTHTETIGHIVDDDVFVGQKLLESMLTSSLVTVEPTPSVEADNDSYRPPLDDVDRVITVATLKNALDKLETAKTPVLIVRTKPNAVDKQSQAYGEKNQPPFFTVEAMQLIVEHGYSHLIVDFPSVDRMYDDGLLTNHHLFWNVAEQTHQLSGDCWRDKTITELAFVPDDLNDGFYLLCMQIPALFTDAAPSRPILFQPKEV